MICVDSDCIIDFLKGKEDAIQMLSRHTDAIATTEINIFEVLLGTHLYGTSKQEGQAALRLLDSMEILHGRGWGKQAASLFASLVKQGKGINHNDCLIAAIMLANNCDTIITGNTRHFSRIKGIRAIGY
ncbi:type II toxin-antitoxin system VapC family toxin [Candidatus Woesearchaeota archaeon]|nr:type II toxin-antitoxin system VapC family toxin [Candidatus Woesearchaeota archaeon]